ncbi:MAG: ATP-binding protein [Sulfobacillus sp.]|nr:ATP-binding protein [Sulfobacillus sp.]
MERLEMGRLVVSGTRPGLMSTDLWRVPTPWATEAVNGHALPRVVYLAGGPGSGKTFYVRQLLEWAQQEGADFLYTPAHAVEMSPAGVARWVLETVRKEPVTTATVLEMVREMNRVADHRGLIWAIDDYDQWYPVDRWLREQVFPLMSPRIVWVMAGSERVRGHWVGDADWLSRVSTVTIQPLDGSQIAQLAHNAGIREPDDIALVTKLSQGNPKVLQTLIHCLAWLKTSDPLVQNRIGRHLPLFLIEQMLHRGSRRLRWRAGWGQDTVDTLIAVASLVPWFDRRLLSGVLDAQAVRNHWDELMAFPLVIEHAGGIYQIAPEVRAPIQEGLGLSRPWSREWWRRRWLTLLIQESGGERAALYADQITALVQDLLFPVHEADCRVGRWHPKDGKAGPREYVMDSRDGDFAARITMEHDLTLRCLTIRDIELPEWWALPHIFRLAVALFPHTVSVRWEMAIDTPAGLREIVSAYLRRMGFHDERIEMGRIVWHLDLSAGYLHWARDVVKPRISDLPPKTRLVDWVQQALHAIRDTGALSETALYQLAEQAWGLTSAEIFQVRILDALHTADLGDWPEGRELLYRYYVERAGSHESLAEQFHVSRATYFRNHRRAIERLTDALFFLTEA